MHVPGLAPRATSAAHTAAMSTAAASTAAAARAVATFATQLLAATRALATTVVTPAPCASPSQHNRLFRQIKARPSHQEKTAPVKAALVQSLSTVAPPQIIMDRGYPLGHAPHAADARHLIEDTPQGKLTAKVPHSSEASYLQGERTKTHVQQIPVDMVAMPPEAMPLESHQEL